MRVIRLNKFRSIVALSLVLFHATEAFAVSIENFAGNYQGVFDLTAETNGLIPYVDPISCHIRKNETVGCTFKRSKEHIEGQALVGPSGLRLIFAPEQMNRIITKEFSRFEAGSGASPLITSPVEFVVPANSTRLDGIQASATFPISSPAVANLQGMQQRQPQMVPVIFGGLVIALTALVGTRVTN